MNNIWVYWGAKEAWTSRKSIENNCLYFPFEDLDIDLTNKGNETLIRQAIAEGSSSVFCSEFMLQSIDLLANGIQKGDWIIIPGRFDSLYHMGEVRGDYHFEIDEDYGLHHTRKVDWFVKNVPASSLPLLMADTLTMSKNEPVLLNERESYSFRTTYGMAVGF